MKGFRLILALFFGWIMIIGSSVITRALQSMSEQSLRSVSGQEGISIDFESQSKFTLDQVTYTDGDGWSGGSGSAGTLRLDNIGILESRSNKDLDGNGIIECPNTNGNCEINVNSSPYNFTGIHLNVSSDVQINGTNQSGVIADITDEIALDFNATDPFNATSNQQLRFEDIKMQINGINTFGLIADDIMFTTDNRINDPANQARFTSPGSNEGIMMDLYLQMAIREITLTDNDGLTSDQKDWYGYYNGIGINNFQFHGGYEDRDLDGDGIIQSDETNIQVPASMTGITINASGSNGVVVGGPNNSISMEGNLHIQDGTSQSNVFGFNVQGLDVSNTTATIYAN